VKSRVPIIVAIILAIVGVVLVKSLLDRERSRVDALMQGRKVVAARQDIPAGTELTEAMLMLREVPPQFIPQQAVTSSEERRQLIGRTTRVPLGKNQIILFSDFEMEKRGGLSSLIPEGERAFTVEIDAGVQSELLQLNDRVDILGIFELPTSQPRPGLPATPDTACVVLLQNVTVIAVGETIGQVMNRPSQFGTGGKITFSVTLPEAQLLMFSSQYGELALALRREGEIQVLAREDLPRVTFEELERITRDLDNVRKNRIVQIMKGREIEEVRIETGPDGAVE
jgi:Flp pilus assembly protein CpaB